jgi:HPt (histidine-containing phosphotransfer) domain-containing protein
VPVFNRPALLNRLMGDEALVQKLTACLCEHMPHQLNDLKQHLEIGDLEATRRQVHTISGALATVGADAMRNVVLEMEEAGRSNDLNAVAARLPELDGQFLCLLEVLGHPTTPPREDGHTQ